MAGPNNLHRRVDVAPCLFSSILGLGFRVPRAFYKFSLIGFKRIIFRNIFQRALRAILVSPCVQSLRQNAEALQSGLAS